MECERELLEVGGMLIDASKIVVVNKKNGNAYIFIDRIEEPFIVNVEAWEKAEKYIKIWC